mmetsp:Transcript_116198/g.329301  ORF Transcript_116198/g.329301 Transcript_116198/m.329301 type:complete len:244 (-) Transcript_116198:229-960(-)
MARARCRGSTNSPGAGAPAAAPSPRDPARGAGDMRGPAGGPGRASFGGPGSRASLPLQREGPQAGDALLELVALDLRLLDLVLEAVPAVQVVGFVHVGELDQRHVLLEAPQHGELEEGLGEELHLVADLRADVPVGLQHERLDLVHDHVDLVRVRRDVLQPLGQRRLDNRTVLDLLRDALLRLVERLQHRVDDAVAFFAREVAAILPFQEHPWIFESGCEHVVEQLTEVLELSLAGFVVRLED